MLIWTFIADLGLFRRVSTNKSLLPPLGVCGGLGPPRVARQLSVSFFWDCGFCLTVPGFLNARSSHTSYLGVWFGRITH